jgi:hypothetical protein
LAQDAKASTLKFWPDSTIRPLDDVAGHEVGVVEREAVEEPQVAVELEDDRRKMQGQSSSGIAKREIKDTREETFVRKLL